MSDQVDKPKHYEVLPGIEAINVIEAVMTEEEFRGYCKGCAMKYLMRANKKHDDQSIDLKKAEKYLSFLEDEK